MLGRRFKLAVFALAAPLCLAVGATPASAIHTTAYSVSLEIDFESAPGDFFAAFGPFVIPSTLLPQLEEFLHKRAFPAFAPAITDAIPSTVTLRTDSTSLLD